jgi:hypothetical protein
MNVPAPAGHTHARKRIKPDTNLFASALAGVPFATRQAGFVAFGTKPDRVVHVPRKAGFPYEKQALGMYGRGLQRHGTEGAKEWLRGHKSGRCVIR